MPCPALPCPALPCQQAGLSPPWQSHVWAPGQWQGAGSPYLAVHSGADGESHVLWDWGLNTLQHLQDIAEALQENRGGREG